MNNTHVGNIIAKSKELEAILKSEFSGTGKGLGEITKSLESVVPHCVSANIYALNRIRNSAAHDTAKLDDAKINDFERRYCRASDDLKKLRNLVREKSKELNATKPAENTFASAAIHLVTISGVCFDDHGPDEEPDFVQFDVQLRTRTANLNHKLACAIGLEHKNGERVVGRSKSTTALDGSFTIGKKITLNAKSQFHKLKLCLDSGDLLACLKQNQWHELVLRLGVFSHSDERFLFRTQPIDFELFIQHYNVYTRTRRQTFELDADNDA